MACEFGKLADPGHLDPSCKNWWCSVGNSKGKKNTNKKKSKSNKKARVWYQRNKPAIKKEQKVRFDFSNSIDWLWSIASMCCLGCIPTDAAIIQSRYMLRVAITIFKTRERFQYSSFFYLFNACLKLRQSSSNRRKKTAQMISDVFLFYTSRVALRDRKSVV